jgi:adenosylcobinamide-GDP ribazoletransferase
VLDALRLAVGTLTIVPTGRVEVTTRVAGGAMVLAPVAVVPLALLAAGGGALATWLAWPDLLAGLVVVSALALGTRALHLDGLADTVDGLGSGRPAEQALTVMRRGDSGPMGVVALVLVLLAQASATGELLSRPRGLWAVVVVIAVSRAALALACARGVAAARTTGLGAAVAGSVPRPASAVTWVLVAVALTLVVTPWWQAVLVAALGAGMVVVLVAHAVRRLGGVTGDVLGAAVELCLTVLLLGVLV